MAVSELLRLIVDADTSGAVRGINTLGAATKRELSKSEQSIQKWGNALTTVGAGMVAVGAVGILGLGRAAKASEEAHLSVVKLENTLQNMPQLAGENSAQFIDLADSLQDVTAADGDQIVAAEAMLGTFRLTASEIKTITPLVVDYSRKFGVDLVSAATQVGKALDGNVGALKRNGVSIDEAAFAADRFGAVQEALAEQVGGFAEEEGKTFAGSIARMKNELGDLAEGVGTGAVDAFSSMFGVIEGITDRINNLSPATQGLIGKIATFGSVGLIAGGGLSVLVGQAVKMHQSFGVAKDAVVGLATRIRDLGATKTAIASFPALLVAVAAGFEMWNQQQQRMDVEKFTEQFLAAGDSVGEMRDVMAAMVESGPTQLITVFDQLATSNKAAAERFIDTAEAAGASGDVIAAMREKLESVGAAEEQTASDTDALAGSMEGAAEGTEEAVSALQEYSDALAAMTDPVFAAMDAITGVRDAQVGLADAERGVLEAQAALNTAIADHGPNSAEAAEATRTLEEAERGLSDAQWATVESAAQADSALAGLQDAVENGDVSVATFKDTLAQWVDQGFLTQKQADDAAASVSDLAGEAHDADQERVEIPVSTPQSEESRERLRRVKEAAFAIPSSRHIDVSMSGYGGVVSLVNRINAKMAELHDRTLTVRTNFVTTGQGGSGGIPLFHEGGIVPGPRGQEIAAILQAGERVISLAEMDAMGRAAPAGVGIGGGTTLVDQRTVTYEIHGGDPTSIVEAIKRYERSNGTGWRN